MRIKQHYFGGGCLSKLTALLQHYGRKQVFILTGKASFEPLKKQIDELFTRAQVQATYFSDFDKNPKIEDVHKGIALLQQAKAQLIIAIGGGSVLDMAKMVNLFANERNDLQKSLAGAKEAIVVKGNPLIAIPTTAGTGSEATHFSVLYINKEKFSVAHDFMMPDHCLIDPDLTTSASAQLTATTGFDAFTQAIESFWSVNATPQSQRYAQKAILLCKENLIAAVNGSAQARTHMALAAHLAGKAINISKTTAPHALSYALTMHYGIDHGHAVALTMPLFIQINANFEKYAINEPRGKTYLSQKLHALFKLLGVDNAGACAEQFRHWMHEAGLTCLPALGLHENDFKFIVQSVNIERMKNNPVQISQQDLLEQLLRC
jgi:alcohol dehydrogenase class IV